MRNYNIYTNSGIVFKTSRETLNFQEWGVEFVGTMTGDVTEEAKQGKFYLPWTNIVYIEEVL